MQKSENKWLQRVTLLAFLVVFLRAMLMSISLDDFDSKSFACTLKKFDLSQGCPFWPPYLVYIWISKFFQLLGFDILTALILPNILLGAASLFFVYGLARRYLPPKESFLCALLLAANPLLWVTSEVAMSDVTSLFFLLGYLYFVLEGRQKLAAFFLALALGTRPWNVLFAVIGAYHILNTERSHGLAIRKIAGFAAWTGAFCLMWLLPLVHIVGLEHMQKTGTGWEAATQETIFAKNPVYSPLMRIALFAYVNGYQLGINPVQVDATSILAGIAASDNIAFGGMLKNIRLDIAGFLGLVIVSVFFVRGAVKKGAALMKIWFFPFLLWIALMQTPYNSRYLAPIIPPFVILLMLGYQSIKKGNRNIANLCLALLLVLWFARGFYLSGVLNRELSPPVQEVYFVKQNFPNATVIGYGEGAFFDWYAPEVRHFDVGYKETAELNLQPEAKVLINARAAYYLGVKTRDCIEFTRDPMAYFKHAYIRLCKMGTY